MRDEYDFSHSKKNPYSKALKSDIRSLWSFIGVTFFLTYLAMGAVIYHGGIRSFAGITFLLVLTAIMWIPGLVSLAVRRWMRIGFDDIGLSFGPFKYWAFAFTMPLVLALISALICNFMDIRLFGLPEAAVLHGRLKMSVVVLGFGVVGAIGEELGWRGFLVPKLYGANLKFPLLISGVIWGLWHLPLVMFGGYYSTDSPTLLGALYFASIIAFSFVIGWLRMRSGSFWTASLMHTAHNFMFQFLFPAILFARPGSKIQKFEIIGSDTGIVPTVLYVIAAILLMRQTFKSKTGKSS